MKTRWWVCRGVLAVEGAVVKKRTPTSHEDSLVGAQGVEVEQKPPTSHDDSLVGVEGAVVE
jgi:hypothetical protein